MDFLKDLSIDKVRNIAEDAINQVKPKTDVEARVYEVLSHKNWGASSTLMNEIARDTYDYDRFPIVTRLMWEAMENQRPSAWRVVFKGLTLLEHLIKNGSERCVDDARNHGHVLRSLGQFNYYEGTIDRGLGVREKSKQLLDWLSDDERVREERQKARKLREKFGGKSATASGGGGAGYAGYGNDDGWSSGAGGGGGGGYGEGGIDSDRGGRYDGNTGRSSNSPYSGRYAQEPSSGAAAPTFATLPDEGKKKKTKTKKKSKKKSEAGSPAAPAPEVDLFSFDDPSPPAAAPAPATDNFGDFSAPAPAGGDDFGAFASSRTAAAPAAANDEFGAFASGRATQQDSFDAFSGAATTPAPAPAFANTNGAMGGGPMMSGGSMNAPANNMAAMNNAFGNMNVGGPVPTSNAFSAPAPTPAPAADDDFGDFADAAPSKPSGPVSSDPMSKLVSLDGLSKNTKKESKIDAPVIANDAAAQYIHDQKELKNSMETANQVHANLTFQGLDGMHPMSQPAPNSLPSAAGAMSSPNVMGSPVAGGSDAISSMFAPQQPKPQQPQQGNMMYGGMQPQQGNPQMMQQMGMNPQMMQGNPQMMQQMQQNPQMMQQMMYQQQQMNPQMMQGNQQMQMSNPQGMMQNNPQMMMNQMGGGGMPQGGAQMGGYGGFGQMNQMGGFQQ